MSADGPGRREVAHRLFAAEFDDAAVSYAESDEERAPKYVVTPTGARVNRLFAVGVLTEVESVNEDTLRARVVDPTGAFVSYAGQYQPDATAFFEGTDPPAFVALTGKARTFEPDDGDRVYTSVRPESVSEVDASTRDRWTVSAAETTLRRVAAMATARSLDARGDDLRAELDRRGYPESLAAGIPIALDRYGTTVAYLDAVREVALDALAVVAGERDAVRPLDVAPDDAGTTALGPLPEAVREAVAAPSDDRPTTGESVAETTDERDAVGAADHADETSGTTAETGMESGEAAASEGAVSDAGTDTGSGPDDAGTTGQADTSDATGADAGATTGADAAGDASDDLGDFDADLGDFDEDDLYELDEEEREAVESEYDVGFESAAEVDDPGEADIDVPGPEDLAADEGSGGAEATTDAGGETGAGDATGADAGGEAGAADTDTGPDHGGADRDVTDADIESAAVETMDELDDGDGADREAVVAAVVEEYGVDPAAVEDAIEEALMSGRCYEPSEDSLKAI